MILFHHNFPSSAVVFTKTIQKYRQPPTPSFLPRAKRFAASTCNSLLTEWGHDETALSESDFICMNLRKHTSTRSESHHVKVVRERYLYLGAMPSSISTHSNYLYPFYCSSFIFFRSLREMVRFLQSLLVLGLAARFAWASPQVLTDSDALVKQRALAPGDQYVFATCPRYVVV